MSWTWKQLIALEPGLEDFAKAAVESARNGWYAWPEWFRVQATFNTLVGDRAQCDELRNDEAWQAAVRHLLVLHYDSRPKGRRRAG